MYQNSRFGEAEALAAAEIAVLAKKKLFSGVFIPSALQQLDGWPRPGDKTRSLTRLHIHTYGTMVP
jgi:hypothetical protein